MKLIPRFAVDNVFVIGGAFLAIAAMAISAAVIGWIGFGVFTGLAVLAFGSAAAERKMGRKLVHGILGVVGLWSLIAALIFTGTALIWLVFAGGIALAVVALGDLTVHEVATENVVRRLVVTDGSGASRAVTGEARPERVAA